jgi:hypothetical protein
MDFSGALSACKTGSKITRFGWNGPGQYVVLQDGYPAGIGVNANTARATGIPEGTVCQFAPYLMLRNAQNVFVPWLASQGDLLAGDWEVVA